MPTSISLSKTLLAFVLFAQIVMAQESSSNMPSIEHEVLLLFVSGFKTISPDLEVVPMTEEQAKIWANAILCKIIFSDPSKPSSQERYINLITHEPFTDEEVSSVVMACKNLGKKRTPITLRNDPAFAKYLSSSLPDSGWRISPVGLDSTNTWAIVRAQYGKSIIFSGTSIAIFHLNKGKWEIAYAFAAHSA